MAHPFERLSDDDLMRIVAVDRCAFGGCDHCPCCVEADDVRDAVEEFVYLYRYFPQLKKAAHRYLALVAQDPDTVARWATDGLPDHLRVAIGVGQ